MPTTIATIKSVPSVRTTFLAKLAPSTSSSVTSGTRRTVSPVALDLDPADALPLRERPVELVGRVDDAC